MNKKATVLLLVFMITSFILIINFHYVSQIDSKKEYGLNITNNSFKKHFLKTIIG